MSKRFKRLKCNKCDCLLERSYTNEYLNRNYPVDVSNPNHKFNMKMHTFAKRQWDCPKCGKRFELNILQYVLIIIDDLRGNYIK